MIFNFEHTYANLPKIFYREQKPEIPPAPQTVIFNKNLDLGIKGEENTAEILSGAILPTGAKPISQAYAGYQFGHFTMLGDGRAVLLGEQITEDGKRFDIQLKGSGLTPFSRNGDGYAALLPMLREYIISEALFYLGIPTTRSLAVVLTGNDVIREKVLQGAVLTRVASSHIRVGTFDYISEYGTTEDVKTLADYSIWRHYPEIQETDNKYILFFQKVAERQAETIAKWQSVGFIHGVMNTDNMTISGETIDFGPCAFMDTYNPDTVFSSIDKWGRYAYKNQPKIGAWNLSRLAESLLPLFHEDKDKAVLLAEKEIEKYWENYNKHWLHLMSERLGTEENINQIEEFLTSLEKNKEDFINSFQQKIVIPRNHRVEEALFAAENGDFSVMFDLLQVLQNPFQYSEKYSQPPQSSNCKYKTFCGT